MRGSAFHPHILARIFPTAAGNISAAQQSGPSLVDLQSKTQRQIGQRTQLPFSLLPVSGRFHSQT